MKKIQLIELVQMRLPVKTHTQVIEKYMELAYGQLLDMSFKNDESQADQFVSIITDVPIVYSGSMPYSEIPVSIAKLTMAGSGVRSIYPVLEKTIKFAPMLMMASDVLDGMEAMELDRIVSFITQGQRVYYIGIIDNEVPTVNMGLIKSFSAMLPDDEVILPENADEQLIEITINLLSGQPIKKKSNDNTSNPV